MMNKIIYEENENKLKINNLKTSKGIIILGQNGAGKSKKLLSEIEKSEELKNKLKIKYIEVRKIEYIFGVILDEETKKIEKLDENNYGFFKFLEDEKEKIEEIILKTLKIEITFNITERELFYNDGEKITSAGQRNMIFLLLVALYLVLQEEIELLLLDEPNTNLDDENSENVLKIIEHFLNEFNKKVFTISTSNLCNIIENLEGYIVYNISTEEVCYSSDILGNKVALKRIGVSYKSQETLISKNKETLLNILLHSKKWHGREEEYIILLENKMIEGGWPILLYEELTEIEKIIFDEIVRKGRYDSTRYKIDKTLKIAKKTRY